MRPNAYNSGLAPRNFGAAYILASHSYRERPGKSCLYLGGIGDVGLTKDGFAPILNDKIRGGDIEVLFVSGRVRVFLQITADNTGPMLRQAERSRPSH